VLGASIEEEKRGAAFDQKGGGSIHGCWGRDRIVWGTKPELSDRFGFRTEGKRGSAEKRRNRMLPRGEKKRGTHIPRIVGSPPHTHPKKEAAAGSMCRRGQQYASIRAFVSTRGGERKRREGPGR